MVNDSDDHPQPEVATRQREWFLMALLVFCVDANFGGVSFWTRLSA